MMLEGDATLKIIPPLCTLSTCQKSAIKHACLSYVCNEKTYAKQSYVEAVLFCSPGRC